MELDFFEGEFRKFKEKWKSYYSSAVEEQTYLLLKNVPAQAFHNFVKKSIWRKQNDPPTYEDFVKLANEHHVHQDFNEYEKCGICAGYGLVSATKNKFVYNFRCSCPLGERQPRGYKCNCGQCSGYQDIRAWNQVGTDEGYEFAGGTVRGRPGAQ